ncbi:multicystatin-like [Haliotis rubra]|uniref:multicystatin-like n=1 Tax=Haliotis rubra TaxID=36100 RepID=UPI001EE5CA93|nr:multicystatin-like [Haliotis rubra]
MNILALVLVVLPLAACQLIGGPMTVDVNRDDIQQMASFALTQLNTLLGSQNTLVSVVQAKTQVVAGINYFLSLEIKNGQETQTCTVTVWSRVWLNDTQVTQHACTSRTKRDGLFGAPTSVNGTGPIILKMATYAVTTLNRLQGTVNSLDQVISAKIQVVAGTNYYFLKIRMSDGSQTQICDVTIWDQPSSYMTQLTHHSCVNAKRRDIGVPGGLFNADVNSTDVKNMANFALGELNRLQGSQNSIVEIISAKTQVVAGMNYFLKIRVSDGSQTQICDVTIWDQPWTQMTQMTHHSCVNAKRRDIGVPGGLFNADVNSTDVKNMTNFALGELNRLQSAQNNIVEIISAKTQVVAGINYFLKIRVSDGSQTQICDVTIWDQPWTQMTQMTHHSCVDAKRRDIGMPGGLFKADVNSPDVKSMTNFALGELNRLQGSQNSIVEIISAKTQVVAGINYFLKIRVSDGSQTQICDVTIWDQPWTQMTQMTHHSCVNAKRRDIGVPGGLFNADVNSTDVKNMTNFALGELNRLQSAQNNIVEIISAKTQVVAGINYFLKIRVSDGSQTQICDVTIWDQPWTQMTQMTHHSCVNAKRRDIGVPGGLFNADVNSTDVKNMANFALGELNRLQSAQNSIVEVISAKTQVVAGMNYILTIRLKDGDKTQICYVKIWSQPWLHRKEMTEHSCSQVTKRAGDLLGGVHPVNINSGDIKQVAKFAVTEINGIQGAQNSLVKIVKAGYQTVGGFTYILTLRLQNGNKTQLCEVRVWSPAWTSARRLTDHHCTEQIKRQLGAFTDADVKDQFIQMLAHYAIQTTNALDGTNKTYVELISAKTQVVAGTNYFFKIRVRQGTHTQLCDITLWRQVWMNSMGHVTEHNCATVSRRSLGGVDPTQLSAPLQQAVSFAEDALNGKMNNMFRFVVEKVENISQKAAVATTYSLDLHLVSSTCRNNGNSYGKGITDCTPNYGMLQRMTCQVTVVYRPSSSRKYSLASDNCGQMQHV